MSEEFIGYCVKCHRQRVVPAGVIETVTLTGRRVMTGECPECGMTIRRVVGPER